MFQFGDEMAGNVYDRFMDLVLTDFERTKTHLAELLGGSFDTRRPRMGHTLQMRADLLHRLHLQQVEK